MAPVWFITAASSGFGHETALNALKRGHTVVATARKESRIQDLKEAGAHTMALDVTWPLDKIEAVAAEVFAKFGRVDYLISAAGYILEGTVEESSLGEVYDELNTNVLGTVATFKAFLPHMRAQEVAADGVRGTVAAFGSLGSWRGGANFSAYAMTKWSISALMESLQPELQPFAITSTVIEPGYFRTSFLNPEAKVVAKNQIPAYVDPSTPSGKAKQVLAVTGGRQLGDVSKGANVLVDILTRTGVAEGKKVPIRIVLGSDCYNVIRQKLAETAALLDEWKDVIHSTDYPEGQ